MWHSVCNIFDMEKHLEEIKNVLLRHFSRAKNFNFYILNGKLYIVDLIDNLFTSAMFEILLEYIKNKKLLFYVNNNKITIYEY